MHYLFLFGSEGRIIAYGFDGPVIVHSPLQMGTVFILVVIKVIAWLYLAVIAYRKHLKNLKIPT